MTPFILFAYIFKKTQILIIQIGSVHSFQKITPCTVVTAVLLSLLPQIVFQLVKTWFNLDCLFFGARGDGAEGVELSYCSGLYHYSHFLVIQRGKEDPPSVVLLISDHTVILIVVRRGGAFHLILPAWATGEYFWLHSTTYWQEQLTENTVEVSSATKRNSNILCLGKCRGRSQGWILTKSQ